MSTLSDAVARVIRRELADRRVDVTEFAVQAGKKKTTGWRQITGAVRMSIDDVEDYATALGWPLERLLGEAESVQASTDSAAELIEGLPTHVRREMGTYRQTPNPKADPGSSERPTGGVHSA